MHAGPRSIGNSGISVQPVGLGGMPLSITGRPAQAQAYEVVKAFVDHGGDFIDTANVYCLDDADIGHNERLFAAALRRLGRQAAVTVATKGGLRRPRGQWIADGRPAFLRASCEQSLTALGVDVITLYQLHAVDAAVGLAESLGELRRLQQEGKILHIGLSNITPEQLEQALAITPIVSVQNRCSVLDQTDFRNGLVALCAARGVAFIAHSAVGGHQGHVRLRQQALMKALAGQYQATPYQLALAWLLHKGKHILPIPGATKTQSILDSLKATAIALTADEVAAMDRIG